jgi:hypothetical protein
VVTSRASAKEVFDVRPGAARETAVRTAIQRAAHQVLDGLPRILDDPVAVGLVPGSMENAIRNAATELREPYSTVSYGLAQAKWRQ